MPDTRDIPGTVFQGGSATLLARVVGGDGALLTQAGVASARYTVHELDETDPGAATPVSGHADVAVPVASLIHDTLQNDALWDVDEEGYNFKYVLDVSSQPAFAVAGRLYRITFELTPPSGQVILVRFRVHAV